MRIGTFVPTGVVKTQKKPVVSFPQALFGSLIVSGGKLQWLTLKRWQIFV
jgi:hypothetical protein